MTDRKQALRSLILFVGLPIFLGCQGDPVGPEIEEGGDLTQQEQTLPGSRSMKRSPSLPPVGIFLTNSL